MWIVNQCESDRCTLMDPDFCVEIWLERDRLSHFVEFDERVGIFE